MFPQASGKYLSYKCSAKTGLLLHSPDPLNLRCFFSSSISRSLSLLLVVILCSSIMASEMETSEVSAAFERLLRNRGDLSSLLPLIFGFASSIQGVQAETRRMILVSPAMQTMVVIEGDSLLDVMGSKNGQPPASKASIDAMPSVDVTNIEGEDCDCVICLENLGVGGGVDVVVKEMPCKHRFHSNCIEKWLRVHGSCPVCRYQMPVEERKKDDEEEEGSERRRVEEIWVTFALSRSSRSTTDENQNTTTDSSDDTASPRPDHELDG